ncbi:nitrogen regulation protein NR(II) [Bacillus sp. AFS017336]|uniref:two-component system sensor histidine kinase NtrB n=1 Tax=Bacillus sp. AFS017336 TaxID=2033489 RepID=UPI000BF06A96|nr:ATP-binding protein [Bacillus sp. AFS017336]PEL10562.1 PAS domain-containing sensor histidine kinase [Bacillus sp. AFS017336]
MINETIQELKEKIAELEEKVISYESILNTITSGSIFSNETRELSSSNQLTRNTDISNSINELPLHTKYSIFFANSKRALQSIYDALPHHILFIDKNGIITLYNQQVANDFRITKYELIGRHIRNLLKIEDKEICLLQTLYTGEEFYNKEILNINYGIINTRIIRDINGEILRVIGIFHNLNEARESEKLAMSGRIAAGIAHEVRNPLTTVRGYLQFLQEEAPPQYKQLFNDLLIPELDRANGIITDFLSITKNANYKPEAININDFISNHIKQLLFSETFLNNVKFEFFLSEDLIATHIFFDKNQLVQVFLNLFHNALDAKKEDLLIINIATFIDNDIIYITFKDNGTGIPSADLPYIFDPFFSTKDDGTGLGLPLTKKLIQNHNGTISVLSGDNGTTFTITLPIKCTAT